MVTGAEHRVERLQGDQTVHDRFEQTESWRRGAITVAGDRLDAHWTDVARACARADQPLAYGPEPLQLAHQLAVLDATVPTDRHPEHDASRRDLPAAMTARRAAAELVATRNDHAELAGRRWPRRHPDAIGRAADQTDRAQTALDCADDTEAAARARLTALDAHQQPRAGEAHVQSIAGDFEVGGGSEGVAPQAARLVVGSGAVRGFKPDADARRPS